MSIDRTERLINIAQTHDDQQMRLDAIAQLGDSQYAGDTAVRAALIDIMQAKGKSAMAYKDRRAAIQALAEIGDPEAVKFIGFALEDESTMVKIAAANALGKLGEPESVDTLITAMQDSNDEVRHAAIEALAAISTVKPIPIDGLIPLLADPNDEVRRIVEDLIEGLNPNLTMGFLLTALEDPNSTIRGAVAEILGELEDERARAALQRIYDNDSSQWVKGRAKWALDQLPKPDFPQVQRDKPAPPPPKSALEIMREQKPSWPSLGGKQPLQDWDDQQEDTKPEASPQASGGGMTREQVQAILDQLDVRLVNGEISEATYNRLHQRWQDRLESL